MKLTTKKLYQLIQEQVERMYQVSNSLIKRLQSDPDVPEERRQKLLKMLNSGDDELIASAEEIMDLFGYGEGYETTDIPISDEAYELNKLGDEKQFYYGDSRRMYNQKKSDMRVGRFLGTKPHQKFSLDLLIKPYFDNFKKRLPSEVMYDESERGSMEEERRLMNLIEDIISSFFDDTEEAYDDMGAENFGGFSRYEDVLTKNMITYYDNIKYKRNNPIDDRLV